MIDPTAPGPAAARGRRRSGCSIPGALFVAICVLAVWVFNREAPRIAEVL